MHHQLLHCTTGVALLAVVCLVQLASCDTTEGEEWKTVKSVCISDTVNATVKQLQARSELECIFAGSTEAGHLVAEWNDNTGQCSVFHYQSVCHLIHAAAGAAEEAKHCTVFARLPVKDIDALNAMEKLRAAWVFDAESGAESENLVCGDRKQWQSEAVGWTKEGAVFVGTSSKMTLNNVDYGNASLGFTWLLRLKRQPRNYNDFMENYHCSSPTVATRGMHFYEGQSPNKLLFSPAGQLTPTTLHETNTAVLTSDATQFINVGATSSTGADPYSLYYNGNFVPPAAVTKTNFSPGPRQPQYDCLTLGFRNYGTPDRLQGTVRAVAIANASMTEAEINQFFDLVG